MTPRSSTSARVATPVVFVAASCMSLQFGAALAVQLFPDLGSWGVSALRLSIAAMLLVLVARPRIRAWTRPQWVAVASLGVSLAGMNGFFYAAIERIPLGPAVAIEFFGPLLLATVLSRRLVDLVWVGIALGGIALFGVDGILGADPLDPLGVALVLIAAAFWALYIRASARVGSLIPGIGGIAMALVIASVVLTPFGVPAFATLAAQPDIVWLAVGTAVFASVVPYTLELLALRRLPQRVFGVLISLEPVFAALFGWLLLAQSISATKVVAIALIVAASAGTTLARRRAADPATEPVFTGSIPTVTGAVSLPEDRE